MSISMDDPKYKILEVCVDSLDSARLAQKAGALRVELCSNLIIGGTTPTLSLLEAVKKELSVPVHVLVRPRFGDFCYTKSELICMAHDIELLCSAGADGFVIGCLKTDGELDSQALKVLMQAAGNHAVSYTLHRAFDMCKNPFKAYNEASELGFDTILTSGQKASCYEGRTLLAQLNKTRSKTDPLIMAGGGLKPEFIAALAKEEAVRCFHLSGKKIIQSPMRYKNKNVSMGISGFSEYELWTVDVSLIQKARLELDLI